MVLVLDNARDSAQVRPLLPGANGCLVLVTSRNELTGLVAGHGARPLTLGLLSAGESRELLVRRLGEARLAAEPDAVDEIITRCARLPLALTIVAARAALRPREPLVRLAAELRDSRARLDALTGDDPASDVRAVFSWSYRALSPAAAELFRLLGLHPGPEVSVGAAASLAGLAPAAARSLLDELTRATLLAENTPGRFTFHDLLRAYAGEQARAQEPAGAREAALRRMVDHYLHTALAADRLLDAHRVPVRSATPEPGVTVDVPPDSAAALQWFTTEQPVLVAVVDRAATAGLDLQVWLLSWALATYFFRRWQGHDWVTTQHAAMAAAERLGDERLQIGTHNDLAGGFFHLGRLEEAEHHLLHALKLFEALGDEAAQAGSHLNIGKVYQQQGRHREALAHNRQGLELFRRTGSRFGEASALNAIGWCHAQLGEYAEGVDFCERALAAHVEIGGSTGEGETWDSLGYCHHHLGDHARAEQAYRQGARLFGEHGNTHNQALCLVNLGAVHVDAGDRESAGRAWRTALELLESLDHPEAAEVRGRLESLANG
jgi:tetratricopeptide (TPR) repeat protein